MKKNPSIIKWAGSKQLILKDLFKFLPTDGNVLVEPFCGSCAVSLNSDYSAYHLNDANTDLINLLRFCQQSPDELIAKVKPLFDDITYNTESKFNALKLQYNESTDEVERLLLFFYLSRHGYNGLMRYNKQGHYNVSFGSYKKPYMPVNEIYFFAEKMKNATFYNLDFEVFISNMAASNFNANKVNCYIDPPYLSLSNKKPSFTQYTKRGFYLNDHERLNSTLIKNRNHFEHVIVSNHKTDNVANVYNGQQSHNVIDAQRTISCSVNNRTSASEIIMLY